MTNAAGKDWVARTADSVIAEADSRKPGATITCASGISPSGHIHLGNFREVMVQHLVADEIRRRGRSCRHILSWDDYDGFRKVPSGVPEKFAEYLGLPLTSVPDPWDEYANWAERFKASFRSAIRDLGIEVHEISQTEMYRAGKYADLVIRALDDRARIDAVLSRYRTLAPSLDSADVTETADSAEYYPYKAYCHGCGRGSTTVVGYDRELATVDYRCGMCAHTGRVELRTANHGKLVWKVDWPMRWYYESVDFEAAGADHSSPGSSFVVGAELIREVFGAPPPHYLGYSFVGAKGGKSKMSGSAGGAPTPGDALRIIEAPLLRWLYGRKMPNQSITIDFGSGLIRLYEEWDRLRRRIDRGAAEGWEVAAYERATNTSLGPVPHTPHAVSFRVLAAVHDIAAGDPAQVSRILGNVTGAGDTFAPVSVEPRLSKARNWVDEYMAEEERTHVRTKPDEAVLASLDENQRDSLDMLLGRLDENWTLDKLTSLVYGIPKIQHGLTEEAKPTEEVKRAQKEFFGVLYRLLVGADSGPRLPTLLLAIGQKRVRELLGSEAG